MIRSKHLPELLLQFFGCQIHFGLHWLEEGFLVSHFLDCIGQLSLLVFRLGTPNSVWDLVFLFHLPLVFQMLISGELKLSVECWWCRCQLISCELKLSLEFCRDWCQLVVMKVEAFFDTASTSSVEWPLLLCFCGRRDKKQGGLSPDPSSGSPDLCCQLTNARMRIGNRITQFGKPNETTR